MQSSMLGAVRGTGAATVSVLAAATATHLTWPLAQSTPMALFYAAVLAGAWFDGVRGGSLAVALSAIVGYYWFLPPYGTFGTEAGQLIPLVLFVLVASTLVSLIVAQGRAAAREREQRRWLAGTLASIGDGVIATDTDGRVTFMNDVAEQLTGWTAGEATGHELGEVFAIFKEGTREPA